MHQQFRSACSGQPVVAAMTMTPLICRNEVVREPWSGPQNGLQARPVGLHCLSGKHIGLPPRKGDSGSDCHTRPQGHLACPCLVLVRCEIHASTPFQILRHHVRVFVQFWNHSLSTRNPDADFRTDQAKLGLAPARSCEQGARCKYLRRNRKLQQTLPKGTNRAPPSDTPSAPTRPAAKLCRWCRRHSWGTERTDGGEGRSMAWADEPGACRAFCASCPSVRPHQLEAAARRRQTEMDAACS